MTESFDQPLKDSGERTDFGTGSVRDRKNGKGRYDLLPTRALHAVAQHFEKGAEKYGDRNWEKGQPVANYLDSALRHTLQYLGGYRDEPHLVAGAWNLLCAIDTLVRIEEGILSDSLNDLPVSHEVASEPGLIPPVLIDFASYDSFPILRTLESNQIDADNSPDDTLARLILERDTYRDAYRCTFDALTSLTSQASPINKAFSEYVQDGSVIDEADLPAATAYEKKAEEIYGALSKAVNNKQESCGCRSGGCEIDLQPLPLVQFTVAGGSGEVYSWDENNNTVHWKTHTHANGHVCEAGTSTILMDRATFEALIAEKTFIVI